MIPHNRPTLGKEEEEAAIRVLRSGWVAQGPEVEAFENKLCSFLGLPEGHAVAVSSGSSALFLALTVLSAGKKNVACPAYACTALPNAIAMAQGRKILIDSTRDDPNIDMQALKKSEADFAIVPHTYGIPASLHDISIPVIEDCARSLGASIGNQKVGTMGKASIFSFSATKLMTSGGQGGVFVSKDKQWAEAARDYREFDCRKDQNRRFNLQLTDVAAAIGSAQLKKLPAFLRRREEIFQAYKNTGLPFLETTSPHVTPVRARALLITNRVRQTLASLERKGIRAINPFETAELLGTPEKFPLAKEWTQKTVSLPIHPGLTDDEVQKITEAIS